MRVARDPVSWLAISVLIALPVACQPNVTGGQDRPPDDPLVAALYEPPRSSPGRHGQRALQWVRCSRTLRSAADLRRIDVTSENRLSLGEGELKQELVIPAGALDGAAPEEGVTARTVTFLQPHTAYAVVHVQAEDETKIDQPLTLTMTLKGRGNCVRAAEDGSDSGPVAGQLYIVRINEDTVNHEVFDSLRTGPAPDPETVTVFVSDSLSTFAIAN